MFDFIKGSAERPTGNLLVYSHVQGYNPIGLGDIIVCNVIVSFVEIEANHFPLVVFPPTSLKKVQDLDLVAHLNPSYDIFQLKDFEIPMDQDSHAYMRMRIKEFNTAIMEYAEMCRDYIQKKKKEGFAQGALSWRPGPNYRAQALSSVIEESSCLDQLERYLKARKTASKQTQPHFRQIINIIENRYPRYDVNNFARAVGLGAKQSAKTDLKLAMLYLRKFRAIYAEKYEKAAQIHGHIQNIEQTQSQLSPKQLN